MKKTILSAFVAIIMAACPTLFANAQGWTNPMETPGLNGQSLGDPYIFKYKGYYYMYVSAGDRNIYCWRTKDLINWSDRFTCCTDETTAVAYAPEVIHWNGKFYMCTSPRGGGHYILTSDSPTGPFTHQTGNLGRDIDGSFFVNDDGKWYFYRAQNGGIHACEMPTHLTMSNDVNLGCCMSGQWTEGPCVFKRNNIYYLLYTGNHVWTNGYRIDYATSSAGPLSGFTPQSEQNPILIDAETPTHKALGHGTAFVGPDLDTYYFCYHNLQDNKSRRLLNYEMIGWNGDKLYMTGPTNWEQDAPKVATNDYFERAEIGADWQMKGNGSWAIADNDHLTQTTSEGDAMALFTPSYLDSFTAEFTVSTNDIAVGQCGAIFGYKDENNYSEVLINKENNKMMFRSFLNGETKVSREFGLPDDFNMNAWHSIRVEKDGKKIKIYIDGMRKVSYSGQAEGGYIGYVTHNTTADFAYIAISKYVNGSSIHEQSIPVPGMMAASFYADVEGDVSEVSLALNSGSAYLQKVIAGTALTYNVNIQKDNVYNIGLRYRASEVSHIQLLLDGEAVSDVIELPATSTQLNVVSINDIPLLGGHHQFTVQCIDGTANIYEYNIKRGVAVPHIMADDFENGFGSEWGYKEGNWTIVDGMVESTGRYGKMLMGGFDDIHLTDYTVDCDIFYPNSSMNAGILVRTTNASTGGADDNPVLGTDFLQGYIVFCGSNSVAIGKHNYGWQSLASGSKQIALNEAHHLRVVVEGNTITAYMDDMDTPVVSYTDNKPFITGRAGLRAHDSVVRFDNFTVTPMEKKPSGIEEINGNYNGNDNDGGCGFLYNLAGQRVTDSYHGIVIKNGRKIFN